MLGEVGVRTSGGLTSPASRPARCMLALLAWQPNVFVADETLIDGIWDTVKPEHPRDSLYTIALRLRRGVPIEVIRKRGGYMLVTNAESVDAHLFRSLVAQGYEALRTKVDSLAEKAFDEALALWSGTPLGDLNCEWAKRTRLTLGQEHLSARISAAEVAIRRGRHTELVAPLSAMAAQEPTDERIAGLLMLALYLAGRRAEAISHFTRIRGLLVAELGIEPGPELRDLHSRLLREEPPIPAQMMASDNSARPSSGRADQPWLQSLNSLS
jgi:DNA-binding SARP family transcriptional activator